MYEPRAILFFRSASYCFSCFSSLLCDLSCFSLLLIAFLRLLPLFLLFLAFHCFFVNAFCSYFSCSLCAWLVLPGFSPLLSFFFVFCGVLIPDRNGFFFLRSLLLSLLVSWFSILEFVLLYACICSLFWLCMLFPLFVWPTGGCVLVHLKEQPKRII